MNLLELLARWITANFSNKFIVADDKMDDELGFIDPLDGSWEVAVIKHDRVEIIAESRFVSPYKEIHAADPEFFNKLKEVLSLYKKHDSLIHHA